MKIADLTDAANPTAATYAKENEMFVRVTARAESEEAAEALCRPVVEEICRRYGDVVYGVDVDNLESVVVRLLSEKGLHLATAESCTGGLVAKLIHGRFRRVGSLRHGPCDLRQRSQDEAARRACRHA